MALRVSIEGRDRTAMAELVTRHDIEVVRTTVAKGTGGGYRVDALVEPRSVDQLRDVGYVVEVVEDLELTAAARRADIDWHPDDLPGDGPRRRRA